MQPSEFDLMKEVLKGMMCAAQRVLTFPFTHWVRWSDRGTIELNYPGVYLLAIGVSLGEGANPLDERVVYIGETCRSLKDRLKEFDESAFGGRNSHSGGVSYRKKIGDRGENLFVAVLRRECVDGFENPKIKKAFIKYAERKLIYEYACTHKRLPLLNKD